VETNSTGGQGSRRTVAPSDDDDCATYGLVFKFCTKDDLIVNVESLEILLRILKKPELNSTYILVHTV
jgi:hypothetical protein